MSNLFGNLTTTGLEETQDRLGGGYAARESGLYTGKIANFYAGESSGGAKSITVIVNFPDGEYRETVYITNKKGENFFLNKQDPTKKVPLPGFTIADDICLVTTGSPLAEQDWEEKMVNQYDSDLKKEVAKAAYVATELIGQDVTLGILKQLENKSEKQPDGSYKATAETRDTNIIDKVFHAETGMTVAEARDGADAGVFIKSWEERNKGNTRDRREIKDGQAAGAPKAGAPKASTAAAPQAAAARPSLFAKKK